MFPTPTSTTVFTYTTLFRSRVGDDRAVRSEDARAARRLALPELVRGAHRVAQLAVGGQVMRAKAGAHHADRKCTRLNSSHDPISYGVFWLHKSTASTVTSLS